MAQGLGITLDSYNMLKEYYDGQDPEALVFRNDPVLARIRRKQIGGKYYPLPMAAYGNGSTTANYQIASNLAPQNFQGFTAQVTPGHLWSPFVLNPDEYLASRTDTMAFISVFAVKAMMALDDLRKMLSQCFYRMGYLEMGPVQAVDATNQLYIDVDPSTAMTIAPQSQILFAPLSNGVPGTYRNTAPVVVQSIANVYNTGYTRITFVSAYASTVAVGDMVMINGGRDQNNNPSAPIGLGGWIPAVGYRTGTAWTNYIGVNFFNINRSVAPDRLAGQFVYRNAAAGESYTQALLRLLKVTRRGGAGEELIIVVNDDDYGQLIQDALANRAFYETMNDANKFAKTAVTQGITQFQMAFSTSWITRVVDSPYCPRNYSYIIDPECVWLLAISGMEKTLDELPTENQPGAPKATSTPEPPKQFVFLFDDMTTITPVDLTNGKGLRVDYTFIGGFGISRPSSCGVCVFN